MFHHSLEEEIRSSKNIVEMLRNATVGSYVFLIQGEYSNWREPMVPAPIIGMYESALNKMVKDKKMVIFF